MRLLLGKPSDILGVADGFVRTVVFSQSEVVFGTGYVSSFLTYSIVFGQQVGLKDLFDCDVVGGEVGFSEVFFAYSQVI